MTTSTAVRTVGFIGLGDQGAPMARALADSRFDLHVWARRPASLDAVVGRPHTVHDSAASMAAASDIVLLVLRDDEDVDGILEEGGVLAAMRPGSILVNHGTGDPQRAQLMATRAAELGIAMLDAPVSGGDRVPRPGPSRQSSVGPGTPSTPPWPCSTRSRARWSIWARPVPASRRSY